ncbi:MAG: SEC-C metal-binding domain-containing protein [Blastocatellia bacterium]
MSVGRNDPCPCGSGKKYKKCCLEKDGAAKPAPRLGSKADRIAPGAIGDYGPPELNEEFFAAHPLKLSPARVINNIMHAPELSTLVNDFVRERIPRGGDESRRIEQAGSAAELVEIMKRDPDPLNHEALIQRALERADEAVSLILSALEESQSASFVELAVQILYRSRRDMSAELLALAARPIANAHALSLVCLLLGMLGVEESRKPLWDCFHFFRERFPKRYYEQGPLIGLYELEERSGAAREAPAEWREQVASRLRDSGYSVSPPGIDRIAELIGQNRRLAAIQVLRQETGAEMEEVRDAIDQLLSELSSGADASAAPREFSLAGESTQDD